MSRETSTSLNRMPFARKYCLALLQCGQVGVVKMMTRGCGLLVMLFSIYACVGCLNTNPSRHGPQTPIAIGSKPMTAITTPAVPPTSASPM
jgi:hypothetical protein